MFQQKDPPGAQIPDLPNYARYRWFVRESAVDPTKTVPPPGSFVPPPGFVTMDTFLSGLSKVVGENLPWHDMVVSRNAQIPTTGDSEATTEEASPTTTIMLVDFVQFLSRFRVEVDGVNEVAWKLDSLGTVYHAMLCVDLPLRQLVALFDHNLSGTVALKTFMQVMEE